MKKFRRIFYFSLAYLPVIMLSLSSYLLSRGMQNKQIGAVQVGVFVFYFLYLTFYCRKIKNSGRTQGMLVYLSIMILLSVIAASPLSSKLPVNNFYRILAVIFDSFLQIICGPVSYICARFPEFTFILISIILFGIMLPYWNKYLSLNSKGGGKYYTLFFTVFITVIEIECGFLTANYWPDYNNTFFMLVVWGLWMYCIYSMRNCKKVISFMSVFWFWVFILQIFCSSALYISQWLPENVSLFLYHTGINHLFYYVYCPFIWGGWEWNNISAAAQIISLILTFILFVDSKFLKNRQLENK